MPFGYLIVGWFKLRNYVLVGKTDFITACCLTVWMQSTLFIFLKFDN